MSTYSATQGNPGGTSNDYEDDPEDWGMRFANTKTAESYYRAKALARQGKTKSNPYAVNSTIQERPNPTGAQKWVPPSGGGWSSRGSGGETAIKPSEYKAPVYDTDRVEALAQRVAAPGVKKLRDQVQQVQGGVYENPNVKAMTLRQALGGYGSGLGDVMGGAFQTGSSIYGKEYDTLADTAKTNYLGNLQREQNELDRRLKQKAIDAQYRNSWIQYMSNSQA